MKITILSIAPEVLAEWLRERKRIPEEMRPAEVNLVDMRDHVPGSFRAVDDSPYGGGAGMVVRCEPVFSALSSLGAYPSREKGTLVAALTPAGKLFTQQEAGKLAGETDHLILLCGHYEGFDERIYACCDEKFSIGDYILSGGEYPAMVVTEVMDRILREG